MISLKKLLAGVLSAAMVLGTTFVPAFADDNVAKIGEQGYSSLADAVAAAQDGETVTLLNNSEGVGLTLSQTAPKNIVIDFNGNTYTVSDAVGSKTYETQAAHFEKGNTVTLKNGTLAAGTCENLKLLIQNYCDLTLENMTLDGGDSLQYILSINHGNVVFKNVNIEKPGTITTIDVMHWENVTYKGGSEPDYDYYKESPTLKIYNSTNNKIKGKFDVYCYDALTKNTNYSKDCIPKVEIYGGTFTADVSGYATSDRTVINNPDGTYTVSVAKIGEKGYSTLKDAVDAAQDGETVTLLNDVTVSELISFPTNITLDLNGKTLKSDFKAENKSIYAFVFNKGGSIVDTAETKGRIESTKARTITSESTNAMFTVVGVTAVNTSTNADAVVIATNGGGLTLKNSTITSVNGTGYALSSFSDKDTDSITDMYTIENTNVTSSYTCLYRNGYAGKFQINARDSRLICDQSKSSYKDTSVAAYISNHSRTDKWKHQVEFENCTISGDTGIEAKYADLTLKDCDITATGTLSYIQNDNGSTSEGFSVVITDNAKGTIAKALPEGTVMINGGKYIGLIGLENLAEAKNNHMDAETKTDIQITGGTFTAQDVTEYTADGYYYDTTDKTVKKAAATVIDSAKSAGVEVTLDNLKGNDKIKNTEDAKYEVVLDNVKSEDKAAVDEIKNAEENADKTVIAYDISVKKTDSNGVTTEVSDIENQKVTIKLPTAVKAGGDVKVYHNADEVQGVTLSTDRTSVSFTAPSFSPYTVVYEANNLTADDITKNVKVDFEKVTDNEYNIVLKATDNGRIINGLLNADLTFSLTQGTGLVNYEITPAANMGLKVTGDTYTFSFDGTNAHSATGASIVIGKVKFDGYCTDAKFAIDSTGTNRLHTTKATNSIVEDYLTTGDGENEGKLVIPTEPMTINLTQETANLTVNVSFPNAINDNDAKYQDMKVTVSGNGITEEAKLGTGTDGVAMNNEGVYSVDFNDTLVKGYFYTVTVSGAGYRTARYTVNMTGNKVLNFWNNVMDDAKAIEVGGTATSKKNFLAGDIVKDGRINIYDLSAVVSYFGASGLDVNNNPGYAKYDLNRDGKIDSKDVAYVLVSWGE